MIEIKTLPHPNKPADALAAVSSLRMLADQLERSAVKEALQQRWTWAQIAESLGVTRQAAHKKHAVYLKNMEK